MDLFIKNSLRQAQLGLGDGTSYATATSATPNQTGKTFALGGFSWITDVGADADDKANSHLLYFPASGNRYTIVDWVAATDTATVHETPDTADTGACEIRRNLVDVNALAANPVKNAADGQMFSKWNSSVVTSIHVSLPNIIQNGGFESGLLSPWILAPIGGTSDTSGVNSVSPILGSFDFKINLGDRTTQRLAQQLLGFRFRKGSKYRLLFKARVVTSFTQGDLTVFFRGSAIQPSTLLNPSSGTTTTITWSPTLTTSNVWHWVDIVPDEDYGNPFLFINSTSVNDIYVDEVYLFEQVNVNSLLISDAAHNPGDESPQVTIDGSYLNVDRTGVVASVDKFNFISNSHIYNGPISNIEFTGGVYPVYVLTFIFGKTASQILLAEKWTWQFDPDMPFDAEAREYDESTVRSRSGVERTTRHSKARLIDGTYSQMPTADRNILMNSFFPHHVDEERHPFAYRLNSTDVPLFVRVAKSKFGTPRNTGIKDDWQFRFKEVK